MLRDVSIYSEFFDIWNKNCRRLLRHALKDFIKIEFKRSHSQKPINRIEKWTLKNIYPNRRMQRIGRMNASLENNLPKAVREDVNDYETKMRAKGFLIRRIPSIDLEIVDKER